MSNLTVYWNQEVVGKISRHPQGKISFEYAPQWIAKKGKPISLSLPCRQKRFPPGLSTAFFENLFPESETRTILAFNHRFDKKDTFSFLEHFGGDCAGALSIVPEGDNSHCEPGRYSCIDADLKVALDMIKADPDNHKLFPEMVNARLSIAGAQDKLPVYFEDDSFFLPENSGSPTTHIIKPASLYFPDIQRNESFCMELAHHIGLLVPKSQLYNFEGHELFLVERFDRQRNGDAVIRVHQEDFCQAMGLPFNRKYQETGGPGFAECRELAEEHLYADITRVKERLTAVMAFNFLIGNNDAHGKNFSVIHGNIIKLAPFYDLVSTQVYPGLDRKLAMAIGKTYRHDRVNGASFTQFSRDIKMRPEKVFEIIEGSARAVGEKYEHVLSTHEKQYGESKIYANLHEVIQKNHDHLQELINDLGNRVDEEESYRPGM
jgi:serine/threonine-protein kinase HipA